MRTFFKAAIAAVALSGASLAAVQPAEARDHTGVAVAAGILGLGVGAALVSSSHHGGYDRGYYDTGYQPYYGGGYEGYYAPSYGVVYEGGYDHRGYDRGRDYRGGYDHHYDRGGYDRGGYGDHGWRR